MKFLLFALIVSTSQVSSQSIACSYRLDGPVNYICDMTINNPNGFDGFTNIPGDHLEGFSNIDVRRINFTDGTSTTIIPQIICQQFPSVTWIVSIFNARTINIGVQSLSMNSVKGCSQLQSLSIGGPVTSIHPETFYNNPRFERFTLSGDTLITIPKDTFKNNPMLDSVDFFNSRIVELPATLFSSTSRLLEFRIFSPRLQTLPANFLINQRNLWNLAIQSSPFINQIPRNFANSRSLRSIVVFNSTSLQELDFFSFNNVERLESILTDFSPIRSIDFNILDRARALSGFFGFGNPCASLHTNSFHTNREAFMAILEPCFVAFDSRILAFSTISTNQLFNSIRRERLRVSIQTLSDAILIFSNSPDGSGSNFEIHLGADDNRNSFLYENGILRSSRATPGLLNIGQFVEFEISWQNGLILVSDRSPILVHIRDDLFPVRFVGVRTRGSNASWRMEQLL